MTKGTGIPYFGMFNDGMRSHYVVIMLSHFNMIILIIIIILLHFYDPFRRALYKGVTAFYKNISRNNVKYVKVKVHGQTNNKRGKHQYNR